jgi:hypothetical protein
MVVGMINIDNNKKCRQSAGNFDHHADVSVQGRTHHPMEHIQGFTDAAVRKVPVLYCPGGHHGWQI